MLFTVVTAPVDYEQDGWLSCCCYLVPCELVAVVSMGSPRASLNSITSPPSFSYSRFFSLLLFFPHLPGPFFFLPAEAAPAAESEVEAGVKLDAAADAPES